MGELWDVFGEDLGENWPSYKCILDYIIFDMEGQRCRTVTGATDMKVSTYVYLLHMKHTAPKYMLPCKFPRHANTRDQ